MRLRRFIVGIALVGLVAVGCGGATTATFELVTAPEAQELIQEPPAGLVLLDVRTAEEFAGPHIANSVNIDFYQAEFESTLDGLDKSKPYLVYCRSGNRSGSTIEMMKNLGFEEVYDVDGGILSWVEAGLPTE